MLFFTFLRGVESIYTHLPVITKGIRAYVDFRERSWFLRKKIKLWGIMRNKLI